MPGRCVILIPARVRVGHRVQRAGVETIWVVPLRLADPKAPPPAPADLLGVRGVLPRVPAAVHHEGVPGGGHVSGSPRVWLRAVDQELALTALEDEHVAVGSEAEGLSRDAVPPAGLPVHLDRLVAGRAVAVSAEGPRARRALGLLPAEVALRPRPLGGRAHQAHRGGPPVPAREQEDARAPALDEDGGLVDHAHRPSRHALCAALARVPQHLGKPRLDVNPSALHSALAVLGRRRGVGRQVARVHQPGLEASQHGEPGVPLGRIERAHPVLHCALGVLHPRREVLVELLALDLEPVHALHGEVVWKVPRELHLVALRGVHDAQKDLVRPQLRQALVRALQGSGRHGVALLVHVVRRAARRVVVGEGGGERSRKKKNRDDDDDGAPRRQTRRLALASAAAAQLGLLVSPSSSPSSARSSSFSARAHAPGQLPHLDSPGYAET
eukprot:CAMPEP_0196638390 /NCGR_PEP_ID=MMETSP1085-20130531/1213_1 /TAXON_ID=41879 ORGANISM="Pycnococcus sp, Strain CCMP1998" /NCGR_SAMPLE_ID=MMETSP1085 /ASSEMBLY_ACC=CAM_ASM_000807 /LENGTH=441 /DNA_ID=CAMNT_0041967205 /DNA_START=44 /DNA_END=1368 /DNA_ORIENTATION=-